MFYQSINPATEELIQTFPELSSAEALRRAEQATKAYKMWRTHSFAERRKPIATLSSLLKTQRDQLAALITRAMGKIITEAQAEIEKCAWCCEYYAETGESLLAAQGISTDADRSYIRYDPLGVILGIMPWNFPFWQVFRFAIPTLMAGNGVIIKPAPNVPDCAIAIEELFRQAGFPHQLLQSLLVSNDATAALIASPWIQGISLTGSTRAGREVAALVGKHLKKSVLELGGSDAFIVLDDADIDRAVRVGVQSRMLNAGQSCIAAKRFIITKGIYSQFAAALVEAVRDLTIGDPSLPETRIGPLARKDLLDHLIDQVDRSVAQGVRVQCGAARRSGKGFFYLPTVLSDVAPRMVPFLEEIFGPVAALIIANDPEDAIQLANQSSYGLGASLWTQDMKRAELLASRIEAGSVFINGMVKSDPRLPFGGIKDSGFGRELGSHGIKEFTNIKTVWIGPR